MDSLENELLRHISNIKSRADNAIHARVHDIQMDMGYYDDDDDTYPCQICPTANIDYMNLCPAADRPDIYENCEVGKCNHCDESERNQLFDAIANDRRHSMITLCFRDPSLNVAPHIAFSGNRGTPDVVGVTTQL